MCVFGTQRAAPVELSPLGPLTQVALCEHRMATIEAAVAVTPRERVSNAEAAASVGTRAETDADCGAAAESALLRSWEHWVRLLGADSALAAEVRPCETRRQLGALGEPAWRGQRSGG